MEKSPNNLLHNPHIIGSTAIALVIIGGAFFASRTPTEHQVKDLAIKDAAREGIHRDLDSDGLESWQEDLWKTDPNNADSDGDGTSDGDEVKVGRDPKKKGPKDRKEDVVIATTTSYYDNDPLLSTTDVVGRDLFSGAVALEKNGQLNKENLNALTSSLVEKARTRMNPVLSAYTPNDIHVSQAENPEVYRTYFNGLATIMLRTSTSSITEKETVTMWTSKNLDARRPFAQKELAHNQQILSGLLPLVVPADLAKPHLALITSLSESNNILSRIATATTFNPVEDLLLFQEFQARVTTISKSIEALFATPQLTTIFWSETDPMAQLSETALP